MHPEMVSSQNEMDTLSTDERLSRISCNTKLTFTLNQIEHVEIPSTFERIEDGITFYVLHVSVRNVQTGIPMTRKNSYDHEHVGSIQREKEHHPYYRLTYRFSDFVKLRQHLRDVLIQVEDPLHVKWCNYCSHMHTILYYVGFPSRCSIDGIIRHFPFLQRLQHNRRRRKLTSFLEQLINGSKSEMYRSGRPPCEAAVNIKFVLNEFLTEPHIGAAW